MEKLAKFFNNYDSLQNCSYILFEIKLQDLMLCIPESEIVYTIISKSLENYNYLRTKNVLNTKKDLNKLSLSDKQLVAFGFSLFYEMYNHKVVLADILQSCFCGDTFMVKYDRFKSDLVIPLRQALERIICDMQKIYNEKLGEKDNLNLTEKQLDMFYELSNYLQFSEKDREYLRYFINAYNSSKDKEVPLKAISYILSNYENGIEILDNVLEKF